MKPSPLVQLVATAVFSAVGGLILGSHAYVTASTSRAPVIRAAATTQVVLEEKARLDAMRGEAATGSLFSTQLLGAALMDRYEKSGDADDLYEAMVWADRGWEHFGDTVLIERLAGNYCRQRVIRWHWFCNVGE
jgi:hypothetical protein